MLPGARARIRKAKGRRGVALFWLVTIIGALGALFAVTNLAEEAAEKQQERRHNEVVQLDSVVGALNDYALTRADIERLPIRLPSQVGVTVVPRMLLLPCPDNTESDERIDGLQDATCGVGTGTNKILGSGSRLGVLPWKGAIVGNAADPGLGFQYEDDTGDHLWYAVARNVAPQENRDRPLNLHHLANATDAGWLEVVKLSPVSANIESAATLSKIAAVVITPGSAKGARIPTEEDLGTETDAQRNERAERALDDVSAVLPGGAATFDNNDSDGQFVDAARRSGFDDRVEYISAEEWWQEGGEFVRRYGQRVGITEIHNRPAPGSPLEKVREMVIAYHNLLHYYPMPAKNTPAIITASTRPASNFHTGDETISVRTAPRLVVNTVTLYDGGVSVNIPDVSFSVSMSVEVNVSTFYEDTTRSITLDQAEYDMCFPFRQSGCSLMEGEIPGIIDTDVFQADNIFRRGELSLVVTTGVIRGASITIRNRNIPADSLPLTLNGSAPRMSIGITLVAVSAGQPSVTTTIYSPQIFVDIVYTRNAAHTTLSIISYRPNIANPSLAATVSVVRAQSPVTSTVEIPSVDRLLRVRAVAPITNYAFGSPLTVLTDVPITATVLGQMSTDLRTLFIDGANVNTRTGGGRLTGVVCSGNQLTGVEQTVLAGNFDCSQLAGGQPHPQYLVRELRTEGTPITIAKYTRLVVAAPPSIATVGITVVSLTVSATLVQTTVDNINIENRQLADQVGYDMQTHCYHPGVEFIGRLKGCGLVTTRGILATAWATVFTGPSWGDLGFNPTRLPDRDPLEGMPLTASRSFYPTLITLADGAGLIVFGGVAGVVPPNGAIVGYATISEPHVYWTWDWRCIASCWSPVIAPWPHNITRSMLRAVRPSYPLGGPYYGDPHSPWLHERIAYDFNRGRIEEFQSRFQVYDWMHQGRPVLMTGFRELDTHVVTLHNGIYRASFELTGTLAPPVVERRSFPVPQNATIQAGDVIGLPGDGLVLTILPQSPLVPVSAAAMYAGWLPNEQPVSATVPANYSIVADATAAFLSPSQVASGGNNVILSGDDNFIVPKNLPLTTDTLATSITVRLDGGIAETTLTNPQANSISFAKKQLAVFMLADAFENVSVRRIDAPAVILPWDGEKSQLTYPPALDIRNYYEANVDKVSISIKPVVYRALAADPPISISSRFLDTEIPANLTQYAGEFLSVTLRHAGSDVDTGRPVLINVSVSPPPRPFIDGAHNIYEARQRAFGAFVGDHPMHYVVSGDCLYSGYECAGNISVAVENGATVALSQPYTLLAVSATNIVYTENRGHSITIANGRVSMNVSVITIGAPSNLATLFEQEMVRQVFEDGTLAAATETNTVAVNTAERRPSRLLIRSGAKVIEAHLQEGQVLQNGVLLTLIADTPLIARSDGIEITSVGALVAFSPAPVTRVECGDTTGITPTVPSGNVVDQTNISDAEMINLCAWFEERENNDGNNRYVIKAISQTPRPLEPHPVSQSNDFFMFFGGRPNL